MLTLLPKTLRPVTSPSFYDWVENGCTDSLLSISRYVPPVFECYVHICHPVWKLPESVNESEYKQLTEIEKASKMVPIRWSEAIKDRNPNFDGSGFWGEVGNLVDYRNIGPGTVTEPLEGLATLEEINTVEKAIKIASNPEEICISAFWQGFEYSFDELELDTFTRTTKMAQQEHFLIQGSQNVLFDYWRKLLSSPQYWAPVKSPQAVWSPSKKWFFAVPFHMHSAIFGGTRDMADILLNSEIEAYELPQGHVFKI